MKRPVLVLVAASAFGALALVACNSGSASAGTPEPASTTGSAPVAMDFASTVAPAIKKNCVPCHSGDQPADGKAFPETIDEAWAKENAKFMKESAHEVEEGKMPPSNAPQKPTDEEKKAIIDWVKANIT